jgi:calcium/calmodulin-dependent protein kinase I
MNIDIDLDGHKFCYATRAESSRLILISLAHADWENTEERYIVTVDPDPFSTSASAPEIMRRERSGKPADMWSISVITYMILAGFSPFLSEDIHELIEECTTGFIFFDERYWKDISDESKDFIRRCLRPKPEDRLTIEVCGLRPISEFLIFLFFEG